MRKALLICCVLLAAAMAPASTSVSTGQSSTNTTAVKTYLLPDLSLKSILSPQLTDALAPIRKAPLALTAGGPPKRGTCRCSCGYPCATAADCGGVSCDPFITCCDKSQTPDNAWFFQGVVNSSHKTPLPEEVMKASCK